MIEIEDHGSAVIDRGKPEILEPVGVHRAPFRAPVTQIYIDLVVGVWDEHLAAAARAEGLRVVP